MDNEVTRISIAITVHHLKVPRRNKISAIADEAGLESRVPAILIPEVATAQREVFPITLPI